MSPFNLDDYVTVAQRIERFYQQFPEGSIQTDLVDITDKRVIVRATVYRTAADERPSIAHSAMNIPGSTPYTKGSEIENAETSAVGRAIAMFGFETKKGLASKDEIEGHSGDATHPEDKDEQEVHLGPITRTGVVVKGSGHGTNLEWRETPDGHAIGFLLEVGDGKPKPEVLIEGILGRALFAAMSMDVEKLAGQKVELDGEVFEVHRSKPRKMAYRIRPTRIVTDTWSIPAPAEVGKFDDGQPVELGLDA